jgi:hypothetical protein
MGRISTIKFISSKFIASIVLLSACQNDSAVPDPSDFRSLALERVNRRFKELEAERDCIQKASTPQEIPECRFAANPERLAQYRKRRAEMLARRNNPSKENPSKESHEKPSEPVKQPQNPPKSSPPKN